MLAQLTNLNSTNVRNAMLLTLTRLHVGLAAALAPRAAVDKATRLFLTPPRFNHSQRERELLATGRGYVVNAPHARLSAWRFGRSDRPAVILSHGWGGRGAQFRRFVPALVDAGYQVIVFDHAGHGHSEGHESSLVHFIRDLEAVVLDLRIKGVTIAGAIGHSLGAAALGGWLKGAGSGVRAVMIAPPHSLGRYAGRFARMLGLPERLRREMQARIERRFGFAWSEFELPQAVAGITAPTLVIHDESDREVPMASGLALAQALQGARFLRTSGLGHRAILRDDAVVADAIDFIRGEVIFAAPPAAGGASAPAPLF
jgi:pimeloyl-ACP methyl ester carboxylesterase